MHIPKGKEDGVLQKFVNETFHIENEYVMQLNPHKFDNVEGNTTERAKPAQNVASARRSASTNKGRKTVKLTPSQVAIAKRLGVPLEEYAKQLKITEGA